MDPEEEILREYVSDATPEDLTRYREDITKRVSALSLADKQLIKVYLQLPLGEILKKRNQFMGRVDKSPSKNVREEAFKQINLYRLAADLKVMNMSVSGGKRRKTYKLKRIVKKKLTRRK